MMKCDYASKRNYQRTEVSAQAELAQRIRSSPTSLHSSVPRDVALRRLTWPYQDLKRGRGQAELWWQLEAQELALELAAEGREACGRQGVDHVSPFRIHKRRDEAQVGEEVDAVAVEVIPPTHGGREVPPFVRA